MAGIKKTNQTAILNILRENATPVSSGKLRDELTQLGYDLSERTVRLYLQEMGRSGLVRNAGRGHSISASGLEELHSTSTVERVGFMSARIDRMTYLMDFDLVNRSGTVIVNVTMVPPEALATRVDQMCQVFERGYAMGRLVALFGPGDKVGFQAVPEGLVGIGTVCSVALNGVLLKYGIPTNSRFGGLLELADGKPTRFVEIITCDGTSIDPLEVFISSGMTDYLGAIRNGNGRIGASFREFPAESRDRVEELAGKLER
ncbi:MAG: NrpR regulatory domain-containing protein, partial [Dehalococcoidia bacterium]|nr:NrpR regulatory domain-containing protein [Dehalococcoidia bacterium]